MTKKEIIRELNVCDFQDKCLLAEINTMANGALWMQKKMLDKACKAFCNCFCNTEIPCNNKCVGYNRFIEKLEEYI